MEHWYQDESKQLAAREEQRCEAWLGQVWARAEAQADREARTGPAPVPGVPTHGETTGAPVRVGAGVEKIAGTYSLFCC